MNEGSEFIMRWYLVFIKKGLKMYRLHILIFMIVNSHISFATGNEASERKINRQFTLTAGGQHEICRKLDNILNLIPERSQQCGHHWINRNAVAKGFKDIVWKRVEVENYLEGMQEFILSVEGTRSSKESEKYRKMYEEEVFPKWTVELFQAKVDVNNDGVKENVLRSYVSACIHSATNILLNDKGEIPIAAYSSVGGDLFYYDGRVFIYGRKVRGGVYIYEPLGSGNNVYYGENVCRFVSNKYGE